MKGETDAKSWLIKRNFEEMSPLSEHKKTE
jgi:hypothetical protein